MSSREGPQQRATVQCLYFLGSSQRAGGSLRSVVPCLSDMAKKSKLRTDLERSIKLAQKRMLPAQIKHDSLGRDLAKLDQDGPTSLDDPDEIRKRRTT